MGCRFAAMLRRLSFDTSLAADRESSDFPPFKWVVKPNLIPANKDGQGHFRRVNCKVWEAFCDMYKGSGPAIKYVRKAYRSLAAPYPAIQKCSDMLPKLPSCPNLVTPHLTPMLRWTRSSLRPQRSLRMKRQS